MMQGEYDFAPFSILVDGTDGTQSFGPTVGYLQAKQWEEAQMVLLNKIEMAAPRQLAKREQEIQAQQPGRPTYRVSGYSGEGLDTWLEAVLGGQSMDPESLIIGYDLYAKAEETLGWLNARGQIRASQLSEMGPWIEEQTRHMAIGLRKEGLSMAHLKILAQDGDVACKATLVGEDWTWGLWAESAHVTQIWEFLLNVRAVAEPAALEKWLWKILAQNEAEPCARYYVTHFEAFAPLAPKPVHRLA